MSRYPVTQGQWRAVMGNNPSCFIDGSGNCPVENISWQDAVLFCKKYSQLAGMMNRIIGVVSTECVLSLSNQ
ncbi:MAG: SUMF1/EgtB/PvdO family nonheme iron enzyme [Bacteroidaceae bacterium]|nr:SUMF1/EgtB/PvdO family nonheme iron enzyme [Bacteroidaceae bacterium]